MHVRMKALVCERVCGCAGCKLIPPTLAASLCRGGARRRRRRRREPKQEGRQAEREARQAVNANKPRRNHTAP